jgi:uncharacterized protein YuzE
MKQVEVFATWEDGGWLVVSEIAKSFLKPLEVERVQLSYDPRRNVAYPRLREPAGTQAETVRLSDEVNVDLAARGTVYGIELLNANAQLRASDDGHFVLVDEVAGRRVVVLLPALA